MSPVEKAFAALDLHTGRFNLVLPTFNQSAAITGAVRAAVIAAANHDEASRKLVSAGFRPLTAKRPKPPEPVPALFTAEDWLLDLVHQLGIDRVLEIVARAEAAARFDAENMHVPA